MRYEDLPRRPAPTAEQLCAAMYDVIGDVWLLLEGELLDALPRRSRRFDVALLRGRALEVLGRCEYLCKRVYGDGWEEAFAQALPPPRRWPDERTKGRRKREARADRRTQKGRGR